ncbi:MAG: trypsin-like serine protease [Amphritea sp.]|nr:trypsin-like serine protease [Amphritea sp.]
MMLKQVCVLLLCSTGIQLNQMSHAADTDKGGAAWQTVAPTNYPMQRKWVNSHEHPWQMIGRINLAGRGHCTATLVSSDQVLTSAHCLWNRETDRWFPAQYITFVAGAEQDSFQGVSNATSYKIAPGFTPNRLNSTESIKDDWALLKLQKPLGAQLGYLTLTTEKSLKVGQKVFQAGYRADRPYVLTVESNCSIAEFYENRSIIRTSCHTLSGDSGGPVLIKHNKQWKLAGIHRGRTDKNQSLVVSIKNVRSSIPTQ